MKKIPIFLYCILFLLGCQEDDKPWKPDGEQEQPRGSAYTILENRGDCTLFIDAVEKSGYTDLLKGKGLSTVMVPTDTVFSSYLKRSGYGSVDDVPPAQLKEMVGLHFLMFSLSKSQMLDFRTAIDDNGLPGSSFKHRTYFSRGIDEVFDVKQNKNVKVYHREKHLPLFSSNYWKSISSGNPQSDYQFFYPNSTWYGDQEVVHGPNFGIKEYAVPTDNGYIYFIDNVIDPLPTIYEKLKDDRFTVMKDLNDRFPNLKYNNDYTKKFANPGDSLYDYLHMDVARARLQNIAFEWPVIATILYKEHTSVGITALMPNNSAFNDFFNSFFKDYQSIDEIPDLTAYYILNNLLINPQMVFPSLFEEGFVSAWGQKYDINPQSDILERKICSNGIFYELNRMEMPPIFTRSCLKPVYQYEDFEIFSYILFRSDKVQELTNSEYSITTLLPRDAQLKEAGFELDFGAPITLGDEKLFHTTIDDNGDEKIVDRYGESLNFTNYHTILGKFTSADLQNPEGRWYETAKENCFIKIHQDTIYTDKFEVFNLLGNEFNNGDENSIGHEISGLMTSENLSFGQKMNNSPYDLLGKEFREKMIKKSKPSYVDGSGRITPFVGTKGILFVLPTELVTPGSNGIPNKPEELRKYLPRYMVSIKDNPTLSLIDIVNGEYSGELKTNDKSITYQVRFEDDTMILTLPNGKEARATGPHFSVETVFYILDEIL